MCVFALWVILCLKIFSSTVWIQSIQSDCIKVDRIKLSIYYPEWEEAHKLIQAGSPHAQAKNERNGFTLASRELDTQLIPPPFSYDTSRGLFEVARDWLSLVLFCCLLLSLSSDVCSDGLTVLDESPQLFLQFLYYLMPCVCFSACIYAWIEKPNCMCVCTHRTCMFRAKH